MRGKRCKRRRCCCSRWVAAAADAAWGGITGEAQRTSRLSFLECLFRSCSQSVRTCDNNGCPCVQVFQGRILLQLQQEHLVVIVHRLHNSRHVCNPASTPSQPQHACVYLEQGAIVLVNLRRPKCQPRRALDARGGATLFLFLMRAHAVFVLLGQPVAVVLYMCYKRVIHAVLHVIRVGDAFKAGPCGDVDA